MTTAGNYGPGSAKRLEETALEGIAGARAALETFYHSLNHRDAATLAAVWGDGPAVVLYNPLGGTVRGREAIAALYQRVFDSGLGVEVCFGDIVELAGADHALFVGRETGSYLGAGGTRVPLSIRTSRYFRRADGTWRQHHHHGSIDDPEALARYQAAVRG